jgi:hypothetical protein
MIRHSLISRDSLSTFALCACGASAFLSSSFAPTSHKSASKVTVTVPIHLPSSPQVHSLRLAFFVFFTVFIVYLALNQLGLSFIGSGWSFLQTFKHSIMGNTVSQPLILAHSLLGPREFQPVCFNEPIYPRSQ